MKPEQPSKTECLVAIDESLREISVLEELYTDMFTDSNILQEAEIRREEAKFARERVLKLSLHIRNMVENLKREL
jgi:glutaredoxin-related protein